jgi:hypothetical protein
VKTRTQTTNVNARMPVDLITELDRWIERQRVRPTRTAVLIEALRRFLANGG